MPSIVDELLKDSDLLNHETTPLSLESFINYFPRLELNATYQRQVVWTEPMKKNLIVSIIAHIPIGNFHLVKVDNSIKLEVLDGKQRITAILAFIFDGLEIEWQGKKITYKQMQDNIEEFHEVLDRFHQFSVMFSSWKPMKLVKRARLFERINENMNLIPNEEIYCPNFLAHSLFNYIFDRCFGITKSTSNFRNRFLKSGMAKDKRFSGVRFIHEVCFTCFGPHLDDSAYLRSITNRAIVSSVKEINDKMLRYVGDNIEQFNDTAITEKMIEDLGWAENIRRLKKIVDSFGIILDCSNDLNKKNIHKSDLLDIITFFMQKEDSGVLTNSMLREYKSDFLNFISDYWQYKTDNELKQHSNDGSTIKLKNDWLDDHFSKILIDQGIKNQSISDSQKMQALLFSNGLCEMCGCFLDDNNRHFDHVSPKSLSSETKVGLLCKVCNLKKSNMTADFASKIVDYNEAKASCA